MCCAGLKATANTSLFSCCGQINFFYLRCFYLGSQLLIGPHSPWWNKVDVHTWIAIYTLTHSHAHTHEIHSACFFYLCLCVSLFAFCSCMCVCLKAQESDSAGLGVRELAGAARWPACVEEKNSIND